MSAERKAIAGWLVLGAVGFLLVPWYALQDSILATAWLRDYTGKDNAPALLQALLHGRRWLLPLVIGLVAGAALLLPTLDRRVRANGLLALGGAGFVYFLAQGFLVGPQGWYFESLTASLGPLATGQYGMGWGATLTGTAFAMLLALGFAERGFFNGDVFIASSVVMIALSVALFTFFPVFKILISAFQDSAGEISANAFFARLFTEKYGASAALPAARAAAWRGTRCFWRCSAQPAAPRSASRLP